MKAGFYLEEMMSLVLRHQQVMAVCHHGIQVHQPIPQLLVLGLKLLQTEEGGRLVSLLTLKLLSLTVIHNMFATKGAFSIYSPVFRFMLTACVVMLLT